MDVGHASFTHKRSKPVYLYFFTHAPPGPNHDLLGAYHGAELAYVFNRPAAAWTDEDRRIGDQMSSYWVNFAKTGNPNGPGLPNWPAFDGKTEQLMELGDHFQPIPLADKAQARFLAALLRDAAAGLIARRSALSAAARFAKLDSRPAWPVLYRGRHA